MKIQQLSYSYSTKRTIQKEKACNIAPSDTILVLCYMSFVIFETVWFYLGGSTAEVDYLQVSLVFVSLLSASSAPDLSLPEDKQLNLWHQPQEQWLPRPHLYSRLLTSSYKYSTSQKCGHGHTHTPPQSEEVGDKSERSHPITISTTPVKFHDCVLLLKLLEMEKVTALQVTHIQGNTT